MDDLIWHGSDYLTWENGERKLTGPGVISRNEQGLVTNVTAIPARPQSVQNTQEGVQTDETVQSTDVTQIMPVAPSQTTFGG